MDRNGENVDRMGRSELHYAASRGDISEVNRLIEAGFDVNLPDWKGWTPLHFAAQASSEIVIARLLESGAAVDPADSFGNTPLSKATFASAGNGGAITVLRAHGADPLLENSSGVSPLDLARLIANFDVAQFYADLN